MTCYDRGAKDESKVSETDFIIAIDEDDDVWEPRKRRKQK